MKWWQTVGLIGTVVTLLALFAHAAVLMMRQDETRALQKAVDVEMKRRSAARDQLIASCEDPEGKFSGKPGVERGTTFALEGLHDSILCFAREEDRIHLMSHRSYRGQRGYWGYKYESQAK